MIGWSNLTIDLMKFQSMPPPPKINHPVHSQQRAQVKSDQDFMKKLDSLGEDGNSGSLFDSNEGSKDSDGVSQGKDRPAKRRKITEEGKEEHLLSSSNSNSQLQR